MGADIVTGHLHQIPPHAHGAGVHDHGGEWVHEHEDDGPGHDHDQWEMIGHAPDHRHDVEGVSDRSALHPDFGTTCGHLGNDPGVSRTIIHHRGVTELVLCGECAVGLDWEALDAVPMPGQIPGRGGQHGVN